MSIRAKATLRAWATFSKTNGKKSGSILLPCNSGNEPTWIKNVRAAHNCKFAEEDAP
jgi:hypothetical protein